MAKATIHNDIRQLRFAHSEMTQQQLADRVGCSRQTIIVLEQERYVPSLVLALQIAHVFGKTVDEVFRLAAE
jgi:putative transcriptional regulator